MEKFMRVAINEAKKGKELGKIPVGAVIVNREGEIMAQSYDLRIRTVNNDGNISASDGNSVNKDNTIHCQTDLSTAPFDSFVLSHAVMECIHKVIPRFVCRLNLCFIMLFSCG
jgi:tRNA(Arg) A34 adenosine deaminase TadA